MTRGRKRNTDRQWMPKDVYQDKYGYIWRPDGGYLRIAKKDATPSEVWAAYEQAVKNQGIDHNNINAIAHKFHKSPQFSQLATNSQKDYLESSKLTLKTFGKMNPDKIQPKHIRMYMDKRGNTSTTRANRERSYLMALFAYGYERGLVASNPVKGIKPFKETPRTRYIADTEYQVVYDMASPVIQVAMELAYLCAMRRQDVLALKWSDVTEEGIYVLQQKTGKKQIKLFSPRLKKAIQEAKNLHKNVHSMYVIHTRKGQHYTGSGFAAIWKRTIKKAIAEELLSESFTFHDIKRKSITDYEGTDQDKQHFSGHESVKMMKKYDLSVPKVKSLFKD